MQEARKQTAETRLGGGVGAGKTDLEVMHPLNLLT